jgi:hemoglobin-like flavoprotein
LEQSKIGTTRTIITMAGLTDDQVKLVKANWNAVKPIKETAADLFYDKLFELDPSIRSLFKDDISIQKKALMATISFCVATLNHPDKLVPAVQQLGTRHGGYGVTDKHYATVGAALLWTLEQGLGEAFTPEAKAAWTEVYGILSTTMLDAAQEAA